MPLVLNDPTYIDAGFSSMNFQLGFFCISQQKYSGGVLVYRC
jgi:hypothetical protein